MKKRLLLCLPLSALLLSGLFAVIASNNFDEFKNVEGYSTSSLPTTIDLNDTSDANIRSYYSNLNGLSQSERQGTNLLKNLKTILKNGQKYYSYDSGSAIWQIYEIADRDWSKSPASSTTYGTYNSSTNKITNYTYGTSSSSSKNNPYIHALYINRNVTNQTTAWDDHQQTQWGINREHVWPKAEGFETSGAGGARGDPMHLMAGNGYANNIHSNYYYGYVNTSSSYTNCGSKYSNVSGNLLGKSKTLGGSTNVFEPQDSDKGDIARAIFYMVARYNYLSKSDSDGIDSNNPNLALTQSLSDWASSGYSSTISKTGKMGIMTDLLAWHHADPVDEYEIHRNNLLYTNYTNNRNPFIDFPEWADFIWGSVNYNGSTYISNSTTPTGYATPDSDTINGYNSATSVAVTGVSLNDNAETITAGSTYQLSATIAPNNASNQGVTWSSNKTNVATVSSDGLVTAVGTGNATITVTTKDGGFTATCAITVTSSTISATGVSLSPSTLSLTVGESSALTATVSPNNATDKSISWSSDNTNVATVTNGEVNAVAAGTATITVTTTDGSFTDTCTVSVSGGTGLLTVASTTIADYADTNSWVNGTKYSTVQLDEVVTVSASPTSDKTNTGKYYTSGEEWRFYQSESATITIEVPAGYSLDSVTFTFNLANTGILTDGSGNTITSGTATSISGNSVTFSVSNSGSATNGQVKFTAISVSYHLTGDPTIHTNGVSLDQSSLTLDIGEETTLVATVTPSTATNKGVEWESSDYEVVDVDITGKVTAIAAGTATITVTTEDGGYTDTCEVTVNEPIVPTEYSLTSGSPFINGVAYKMYFTSNNARHYFTGEVQSTYYGKTSTKKSEGVDVYFEERDNYQNIFMIYNGEKSYFYTSKSNNHTNFKFDGESAPNLPWTYDSTHKTMLYNGGAIGGSSGYTTFAGENIAYYACFETEDSNGAEAFSTVIQNSINCNSAGTSKPTFTNLTWTNIKEIYNNLDGEQNTEGSSQYILKNANANPEGTIIEQFVARYDYIVGKYGTSEYEDFLSRNPVRIGNNRIMLLEMNNIFDESNLIVIIVAALSIISIGVCVILKRRRNY